MPRTLHGALAALVLLAPAARADSGLSHLEMDVMDAGDGPSKAIQDMEKRRRAEAARRRDLAPEVPAGIDERLFGRSMPALLGVSLPAEADRHAHDRWREDKVEKEEKEKKGH